MILSFSFPQEVSASFVEVDGQGKVIVKVLSSEANSLPVNKPDDLEVKRAAGEESGADLISLARDGERISLSVGNEKRFDVTSWEEDLVEVEERDNVKKILISVKDNRFIIRQEEVSAVCDFPIRIDPVKNRFTVETPSGEKYLAVLPYDAAQSALRAKAISSFSNSSMDITEEEKDLSYSVKGEKSLNILNVYRLNLPVTAKISASTGEVLGTDEPVWLKILSFLMA